MMSRQFYFVYSVLSKPHCHFLFVFPFRNYLIDRNAEPHVKSQFRDVYFINQFFRIGTFPAQSIMTAHTVFRFVVAFLVPFVVMVICNLTIIHFLRKRRSKVQIIQLSFLSQCCTVQYI